MRGDSHWYMIYDIFTKIYGQSLNTWLFNFSISICKKSVLLRTELEFWDVIFDLFVFLELNVVRVTFFLPKYSNGCYWYLNRNTAWRFVAKSWQLMRRSKMKIKLVMARQIKRQLCYHVYFIIGFWSSIYWAELLSSEK